MAERRNTNSTEIDKMKSTSKALIVALILASFFLGFLTNKVATLEKNTSPSALGATTQQPAAPAPGITNDNIKTWAKELGLNSGNFSNCFDQEKYKDVIAKDQADGATASVNGTPAFFINGILVVGAQPFDAFKTIIDQELAGTSPASSVKTSVDIGHLPALGDKNAKVTIIDFSDFECPFCRRFFEETFSKIKKDYIDTGKAVFYYRHFPLAFHPLAQPFAQASECANEQGKFWEMHDKIFQEQGV